MDYGVYCLLNVSYYLRKQVLISGDFKQQ